MDKVLDTAGMDLLFREARTHSAWLKRRVDDATLQQLYSLTALAPTSANSSPARFVFLRSDGAKKRLVPALWPGNLEKTLAAPVTAIIACDLRFFENLPELLPQNPAMKSIVESNSELSFSTAQLNTALQGAYMIIAARALGLDCGPMAGFTRELVDQEFFPEGRLKSIFLCNLGYGDPSMLRPRNPRLQFNVACTLL